MNKSGKYLSWIEKIWYEEQLEKSRERFAEAIIKPIIEKMIAEGKLPKPTKEIEVTFK